MTIELDIPGVEYKPPAPDKDPVPVGHLLHRETEAARVLLAHFRNIIGDDEEAQADMVEGETNLLETIDMAVQRLSELKAMRSALEAAKERIDTRDARFANQEELLRVAVQNALAVAGKKKHEHALATMSRTPTQPGVVITKEEDIPSKYWKRGDPKVDKTLLKADLKAVKKTGGDPIPGAELSDGGETLTIRWR
jgi:hypothetical protein